MERVVALLEKSLSPDARVFHNVKLPCLTTGHSEQCDVVVEMGQVPRVIRTIVEVQKRNERVKPNDFRGWCQKMRDVGANRLICVSAKPFPRSIKDKVAKELGPTVLLVLLKALEANQWPFQIVNHSIKVLKPIVKVKSDIGPNPLLLFNPHNNPFAEFTDELLPSSSFGNVIQREGKADLLPIQNLIDESLSLINERPELNRLREGIHTVELRWRPQGTSLCLNGRVAPIQEVRVVVTIEYSALLLPFEVLSYTQEGHDTLAWLVRASGRMDDQRVEIQFTLVPRADGGFSVSFPQVSGFDAGGFLTLGFGDDHSEPE